MADKLMTADEVAEYLRVEKSTIYTWAKTGSIPAVKLGRIWRFDKNLIDKWILNRANQTHST